MTPAERLERAREKATRAERELQIAAVKFSIRDGASERDALRAAAKTCTNAWHEVGRAEKAVSGD